MTVVQITNTTITTLHYRLHIYIVYSYSVLHAMNIKQPPPVGRTLEEYTMLEESNAFTMVFLDLSSLQQIYIPRYSRLRITDWQHWVFVVHLL